MICLGYVWISALAFGEAITNWAAPVTWSPHSALQGLTTMADVTGPLPFVGLAPCRIVDTRGNGAPIQGGIFTGGSDVRNYAVSGLCGIPASVRALSLNFTVTGPGQTGAGFLLAWTTGGAVPPVSILHWDRVPEQIANAAVVPTNGSVTFTVNVSSPTHVIIDVNGYYASSPANLSNYFEVTNSSGWAILGKTTSSGFLGRGVLGIASATTGETKGVFGETDSSSDRAAGVEGYAPAATGETYGVRGVTLSTDTDAAGVYGVDSSDPATSHPYSSAGVRGASTSNVGVLGISKGFGIEGLHVNSSGTALTAAILGYNDTDGVFAVGQITATGAKPFIEPHPTDATKEIAYVALEGPEAGTYFRGRGRVHNGNGVIQVPESFRLVSDEEGLTVQITPIGQAANVAVVSVVSADLNRITVQSSLRDLEFFYVVNGVRKAFKDWEVITENRHYVPEGPEARMPGAFAPEQRRHLIATGIYNEDGTVNLETAERLGWAKVWRDRKEQAKAAAAAFREAREANGDK